MAQIIINGVTFVNQPTSPQTVTVKYRKTGDPDVPASYVIVSTGIVVGIDGTITPPVQINNLDDNTSYTLVISNNCSGRARSTTVITEDLTTFVWVEDVFVCEQDGLITKVLETTGFSSPNFMYYNKVQNRMYVVDADAASGNVFWFNPDTFAGTSSVTYSTKVHEVIYDGAVAFDDVRKKIYMAGLNTHGLIVYDMATDTIANKASHPQLDYGADTPFDRLTVKQIGDFVYASSRTLNTLAIFNANNLTKVSNNPTSSIPSGTFSLSGSYQIHDVNGQRWVTSGSGRTTKNIHVYNNTFTTLIAEINLPATVVTAAWGQSQYWGSGFFDQTNNNFYYHDIGSSKTFIYDATTRVLKKTLDWPNKEGKLYAQVDFSFDPNVGRLYFNYMGFNSTSDATSTRKYRSYIFNRTGLFLDAMYPGLVTSNLRTQQGSKFLWSANRGLATWDNTGAWSTDGVITKFSY